MQKIIWEISKYPTVNPCRQVVWPKSENFMSIILSPCPGRLHPTYELPAVSSLMISTNARLMFLNFNIVAPPWSHNATRQRVPNVSTQLEVMPVSAHPSQKAMGFYQVPNSVVAIHRQVLIRVERVAWIPVNQSWPCKAPTPRSSKFVSVVACQVLWVSQRSIQKTMKWRVDNENFTSKTSR